MPISLVRLQLMLSTFFQFTPGLPPLLEFLRVYQLMIVRMMQVMIIVAAPFRFLFSFSFYIITGGGGTLHR